MVREYADTASSSNTTQPFSPRHTTPQDNRMRWGYSLPLHWPIGATECYQDLTEPTFSMSPLLLFCLIRFFIVSKYDRVNIPLSYFDSWEINSQIIWRFLKFVSPHCNSYLYLSYRRHESADTTLFAAADLLEEQSQVSQTYISGKWGAILERKIGETYSFYCIKQLNKCEFYSFAFYSFPYT